MLDKWEGLGVTGSDLFGVGKGVMLVLVGALALLPDWKDQRDWDEPKLVFVWGRQSLGRSLGDGLARTLDWSTLAIVMDGDGTAFTLLVWLLELNLDGAGLLIRVTGALLLAEPPAVELLAVVLLLWRDFSRPSWSRSRSSSASSRLCFSSRSVTTVSPNSFCKFARRSSYDSVSILEIVEMVSAVFPVGLQSTGQRTPCLATAWKASSRRSASRTERPTLRLLSVI